MTSTAGTEWNTLRGVDKAADEPRAADAVDLGPLGGDPLGWAPERGGQPNLLHLLHCRQPTDFPDPEAPVQKAGVESLVAKLL